MRLHSIHLGHRCATDRHRHVVIENIIEEDGPDNILNPQ